MTGLRSRARDVFIACVAFGVLVAGESTAHTQGRDSLLNGAVIGAAVGAGIGVAFTHAVRDSDLTVDQYAYGALVIGALGAGVGLGVDALLSRALPGPSVAPRRVSIAPTMTRKVRGVAVKWRW